MPTVWVQFIPENVRTPQDSKDQDNYLPPTVWWDDWTGQSDPREYAVCNCCGVWGRMGPKSAEDHCTVMKDALRLINDEIHNQMAAINISC